MPMDMSTRKSRLRICINRIMENKMRQTTTQTINQATRGFRDSSRVNTPNGEPRVVGRLRS